MSQMNRREAVRQLTLLFGGVMSAPLMAGAMGEKIYFGPSVTVSKEQELLLAEIADVIIPSTTTPGAKAAGVEQFIVRVMRDCYVEADQVGFYQGLDKAEKISTDKFGKSFLKLEADQKNEVVRQCTVANKPFFQLMKSLTVTGYFTSEIGATQALDYLPVPGRFEGAYPLKPDQKTWAL